MIDYIEADIEGYAVKKAAKLGWFTRKLSWIGCDGAPDRLFAHDGQIVFIEFKSPTGELSDSQMWEHRELAKQGVVVHVIDSIEGVDALIK
jgi:hypothetical protein